jgi:aerobic carbon-monoxide dehydrogenase small subunit
VIEITFSVNGTRHQAATSELTTVAELLRGPIGLQGTKIACGEGTCGACTVLVNGAAMRSCLMFAIQADGAELMTVEGLAQGGRLHPLQEAFWENHGLQCGFCTPGILLTAKALLDENPSPDEAEIREAISGNLCRCTGYHFIVEAIALAARARTST